MEKGSEINYKDDEFVDWLVQRLCHLHNYDTSHFIINRLKDIKTKLEIYNSSISDDGLDKIISQYFVDFFLERDSTTSIGYNDKDRKDLRNAIKCIISDVNFNRIPKKILLQ